MQQTSDIILNLKAEFPRELISWRVQGKPYEKDGAFNAMALAYIDARDVMNRLDEVVGAENWSDSYHDSGKRTYCTLSIRINGEWISKTDAAGDSDVEAEKGAVSDALKRAAVKWGIGRYLYDIPSPWVPCVVKDGKWREWIGSPWDRVKLPQPAPAPAKPFKTAKERTELFSRIKQEITGSNNLSDLQIAWENNADDIAKLKASDIQIFHDLEREKDRLKKAFRENVTRNIGVV